MKLFPFQEAFKSGSSVCPHRKFLCFNFPKKEISLRSEPSICLWAELFQETLAAESWKHPWLAGSDWDAGINSVALSPQGMGTPLRWSLAPLFLPLLHSPEPLCQPAPTLLSFNPPSHTQSFNSPRGDPYLSLSSRNRHPWLFLTVSLAELFNFLNSIRA